MVFQNLALEGKVNDRLEFEVGIHFILWTKNITETQIAVVFALVVFFSETKCIKFLFKEINKETIVKRIKLHSNNYQSLQKPEIKNHLRKLLYH